MSIPPLPELELAAKKIVWTARKEGNLKHFTPRLVRATLEEQFQLDEGTLGIAEYKSAIKAATKAALNEDSPVEEGVKGVQVDQLERASSVSRKKRKSDGAVKEDVDEEPTSALTPKGKGKMKTVKKNEHEEEKKAGPRKRRKVETRKKQDSDVEDEDDAPTSSSRRKGRQTQRENMFKSAEHVPTSDMEQDEPEPEPTLKDEKTEESTAPISPKKNATRDEEDKASVPPNRDLPVDDSGAKSGSELSSLFDEPPKPKRRSGSKSEPKEPKKTRAKKETPTLSKDEEKIKRLKSFVVGCGVRKVWSKVFKGLDTPKQQITKLEEILGGLGMRGRMSMEQAKAIKQKRELAQELEDVQAFAKAVEAKDSGVGSRKRGRKAESSGEEDEGDKPSDGNVLEGNARKSIMDFLQDQSSEDE